MNSAIAKRPWMPMMLAVAALLAAPGALAQDSIVEHMARMHTGPDEHYFFEADRKQVVDFKTEQMVRICTGKSGHGVPLKVTYDGETEVQSL